MKAVNFAFEMESLRRFFCFLFPLLLTATVIFANNGPSSNGELNPFEENGKFGLKNQKGDILIPAQYDALGWSNGLFSVVENVTGYEVNGKWGLINLTNHKVTKPEFTDLSPASGSIIIARKRLPNSIRVATGCISSTGKTIVPFQYDGLSTSNLRAIVYNKDGNIFKHGLIDFDNNVLIPLKYQAIYPIGSLRFAVVSFENKTAIFSDEGKQLTQFLIDSIDSFKKNFAVIYQNQLVGLINREGGLVLEPTFREIKTNDDGTVHTRKPDSWLFLKAENQLVRETSADSIHAIGKNLYKATIQGNTQLLDENLKPLNGILFNALAAFANGKAVFVFGDKKGVVRKDGRILIEPIYQELVTDGQYFLASQARGKTSRWALLDSVGKAVTTKPYEAIGSHNGEFFPVKSKGFWGALNERGKEFVACVHDSLIQYRDDHIVVKFKGQFGIINTREDWIITPQKNPLILIGNERYLEISSTNKFLKNLQGEVIYFTENKIEVFNDHLLEYLSSGMIWKIDFTGIIADRFVQTEGIEKTFAESEGYRAIKKDGRYGFIDSRSRLRIANRYENVRNFSEGLAGAQILGKWGFINKEDKIAIQPVYEEVFSFNGGFAVVRQKNNYGLIDKSGKVILPVRYESIRVLSSKRFEIRLNGLYGLADEKGKIVVNPKFDNLEDIGNGYIIVGREGRFGVIDSTGLSTIPLMYDGIKHDAFHNQFLAVTKADWVVQDQLRQQ